MLYEMPLIKARLIKRYKRFLADVEFDDGSTATVHCANTGSMKNCVVAGSDCWLFDSQNPKRKYPLTWELATTPCGGLAGINTARANALIVEGIANGKILELQGYEELKTERKYGEERSRIDILLSSEHRQCFVEVKSVTLSEGGGQGFFPDSVTARGTKHLRELMAVVARGDRAVLLFCVQHSGITVVSPAAHIDKLYSDTLRAAVEVGVEVYAYRVAMSPQQISVEERLPVVL